MGGVRRLAAGGWLAALAAVAGTAALVHAGTAAAQAREFCLPPKVESALCLPSSPEQISDQISERAAVREDVPAWQSVAAMDGDEAQALGAVSVGDALHLLPGVHFVSHGGLGSVSALSGRGSSAGQVAVVVDGMPLADASSVNHTAQLHGALLHDMERLEWLRGSQSVLYGSGALGGAVRLVTRAPQADEGVRAAARAGYGSYRTSQVEGALEQTRGRLGWRMSAAHLNREGYSRIVAGDERDGTELYQWRGRARVRLGEGLAKGLEWTLIGFYGGRDVNYDPTTAEDGKAQETGERWRAHSQWRWRGLGGSHVLSAAFAGQERRNQSQGAFPFRNRQRGGRTHLRYQLERAFAGERVQLTAGGEWQQNMWEAERVRRAHAGGAFVQLALRPRPQWRVVLGGRAEGHDRFGSAFAWQGALAKAWPALGLSGRVSYSGGFKAPSLYQLYAPPLGTLAIGNAQLRPERSEHWEVGATQTFAEGRLMLDASWFMLDVREQIGFELDGGYQNTARTRRSGVEVEARWRALTRLQLAAHYVYLEARNLRAARPQPRVPRHAAGLRVSWKGPRLGVFSDWRYVGRQWDDAAGARQTPAWHVWNLGARWRTRKAVALELQLRNLLDRRYQSVWGYREPGFNIFAAVRASF